jgi:hypothetical protein
MSKGSKNGATSWTAAVLCRFLRAVIQQLATLICLFAWVALLPSAPAAEHWAFQPLHDPPLPSVRNGRWPKSDIDYFILREIERRGVEPSPRADKHTLLRRVTYDLTGLPPAPEEIIDFIADRSQDAFARVVDRLLGSPAYGERWGRHWLDLARYADTAGDSADYPIPQAYKYRDYVINALNRDKPYDQFLREQIAGDLMTAASEREWREQIVATGFLAMARRFSVEPDNAMHLTIEDTLDTIGRSVLGLSFSCARCHDHKYDPVSMRDYYGLYGIFSSTRFPYAGSEEKKKQRDFVPLMSEAEMDKIYAPFREQWDVLEAEIKRLEKEAEFLTKEGLDSAAVQAAITEAKNKRHDLVSSAPPLDTAYAVAEGKPSEARIQVRGEPSNAGETVPRGALDLLGKALRPAFTNGINPSADRSGRLEFANWLTDPKNPLSARVIVNRVWQHHFGRGLVATSGDFGTRGQEPSHPELLDYLASRFIESGWSIKALHRRILVSSVYQQSSLSSRQTDPENRWLARMSRRRLDAEAVRDSMLAVSGALDLTVAGEHPFPAEANWQYTQHAPFTGVYATSKRSVYVMQQRIRKHPFFAIFDGADPNVSTAERSASITPLQALFAMNDKFSQSQAKLFAQRTCREQAATPDRIRRAYLLAFGRLPSSDELLAGETYLKPAHPNDAESAWVSFARALMASNEFIFLD